MASQEKEITWLLQIVGKPDISMGVPIEFMLQADVQISKIF